MTRGLSLKKFSTLFFLFFILSFSLLGCMNAAVTSAQMVYDRHSLQNSIHDHTVSMKIYRAIYFHSDRYKETHINITTFNNIVLLTGEIPTSAMRQQITCLVKQVSNAEEVYNLTVIGQPPSELTHLSDSWITAKIKSKLISRNDVNPSQIKVVTENGTVYLMGILPPEQAEIAVDVARETDGVQNVIKIFSYLRITKH